MRTICRLKTPGTEERGGILDAAVRCGCAKANGRTGARIRSFVRDSPGHPWLYSE